MPDSPEEMIVLLKERWEATGHAPKLASHHNDTPLHLAFTCYAFNPEGKFLLTRRALTKKTWPGAWTNSCCGHPAPGESLHAAVTRRLQAELGVHPDRLDTVLAAVRYRAVMDNGIVENEVGPVVRALLTQPPRPDPDEVETTRWTAWPDLVAAATEGAAEITPWSLITIRELAALGPDPWKWPSIPTHELPGGLH
ncbi:isopentenyl-diphosphate Delta-isomerase [Streptomyces sp. NPDC051555]|uniref:isopentenyl-diphosphate Delta-isomerase n=1 Tax=Streptomyces sp. NPDC051555 TaxID=3365657 RepID=UPI00379E88A3